MIKTQHCPNCEAQAAEIEHLKDVYSSATECFLEADAENKRLRDLLRRVTPPTYFGESEQNKAWWAEARAALEETK